VTGLVVDLFAGGGGASAGIEAALGRHVDVAINHNPMALRVHEANHPETEHMVTDVWDVDPLEATKGRPVDLLWASPDCRHHSRAKGGKPRNKKIRSLAWVVTRWAKAVRPKTIFVENVPELLDWGPLLADGTPCKRRKGKTFRAWAAQLRNLGYAVEWRILDASHYGAPTRRKRVFIVARCDGEPIVWPAATHGKGLLPFKTAADCIDWSLPCPSIFGRKKPLAEKTMWRIAQGLKRFVFESARPFVIKVNHGGREDRSEDIDAPLTTVTAERRGHALVTPYIAQPGQRHGRGQEPLTEPLSTLVAKGRHALVAPILQHSGNGERKGQKARHYQLDLPLGTVMATGQKHALCAAWLVKHFGDPLRSDGGGGVVAGSKLDEPVGTVTARDHHSLAAVCLAKFNGNAENGHPGCVSVEEPLPTITSGGGHGGGHVAEVRAFLAEYPVNDNWKANLGIVTIDGVDYQIVDIGFRMLEPHELARAQFGRFAADYDLSAAKTKAQKVFLLGNSVCPEVAEALVRANCRTEVREAA